MSEPALNIKLIMMLKNEDALVRPWIAYHGALLGFANLIVLDNGSSSAPTLAALDWARGQGVTLHAGLASAADYLDRGRLYCDLIRLLDQHGFADFWFPLDCDEFLTVDHPDRLPFDRASLQAALAPYQRSPHPLRIAAALNNHPLRPGWFLRSPQEKTFFAAGACEFLDHGFHHGRSRQGLPGLPTPILYLHYHYKPFELVVEHARAKLAPRTDDFSREGLLAYSAARKPSFHLVNYLLTSKEAYHASFQDADYRYYPEIADAFARLGQPLPFG